MAFTGQDDSRPKDQGQMPAKDAHIEYPGMLSMQSRRL
jgi:hypothetical protein